MSSGIDLGKLETPNRARSIQAMKSAWAFYNASSKPRGLVQCRLLIASGKYGTPDPKDHQAVGEALDKWLVDHKPDWPYRKYYTTVVNNYMRSFIFQIPYTRLFTGAFSKSDSMSLPLPGQSRCRKGFIRPEFRKFFSVQ